MIALENGFPVRFEAKIQQLSPLNNNKSGKENVFHITKHILLFIIFGDESVAVQ